MDKVHEPETPEQIMKRFNKWVESDEGINALSKCRQLGKKEQERLEKARKVPDSLLNRRFDI